MKKPKSVPSSSSYRENMINASEDLHSKSLGCMSGIFHFVYNKYHHNRKSLTFAKKKTTTEKNIVICSSTKQPPPSPAAAPPPDQPNEEATVQQPRRFSCEVVPERSTGIAPEIRRSNSVNSPANFRPSTPSPPHSVVARLMGLTSVPPESKLEKRRKLMGALEKCDQDLKALKKIIDAVRSSDLTDLRPDPTGETETETKTVMSENEQPSPVSVLDELTRSPTLSQTRCDRSRQSNEFRSHISAQEKTKKGDEDMIFSTAVTPISLFDRMIKANTRELSIPTSTMKRSDEDDVAWPCTVKMKTVSRGIMMESVEQVCKDIAWGQNREVGRIGLALHDHICRDLIEELVKELGYICRSYSSDHHVPRFEACRRSLRF